MKPSPLLLLFIFLLSFANCKKKDNRNYSYWQVNQDKFSSNNVSVDIGKAIASFSCNDFVNNFTIAFHFSFLPLTGTYPINKSSNQNPDSVILNFYYNGNFYLPKKSGYLNIGSINGKTQCTLPPTWYCNYSNSNDSVLINGTFNEP
jgi:hypothetical protein